MAVPVVSGVVADAASGTGAHALRRQSGPAVHGDGHPHWSTPSARRRFLNGDAAVSLARFYAASSPGRQLHRRRQLVASDHLGQSPCQRRRAAAAVYRPGARTSSGAPLATTSSGAPAVRQIIWGSSKDNIIWGSSKDNIILGLLNTTSSGALFPLYGPGQHHLGQQRRLGLGLRRARLREHHLGLG